MRRVTASAGAARADGTAEAPRTRPLLSVVIPVYNGGDEIVGNVGVVERAVADRLADDVELIVVSDGSIDGTAERLLASRSHRVRVIHYDRNLGKGYAIKSGALAAHGDWIGFVDADLDLDPAALPDYLELARSEELDFAIGSKRHAESVVHYPRSRRVASWCYQQLNRLLFRLDVRDTQVGLKVFSRRVVDEVMPLLLVKRFAFDLELLAVANALGYGRIRELPVRLEYRFTGSGVGSVAVVGALWDTAAIFYRLRVLKTYARKRRFLRRGAHPPPTELPLVTVVGDAAAVAALDYPRLEVAPDARREEAVRTAHGDAIALLGPRARPAGNWVSAAAPYFADPDVAAVVAPTIAPVTGTLRESVAAAVLESRLGAGSRRSAYFPGNVRVVSDYPADSVVARTPDFADAVAAGVADDELVAWLHERGRRTIYTPDTFVTAPPPPLVRPHLAATARHGYARGAAARRSRGRSLSSATARSVAPAAAAVGGGVLIVIGGPARTAGTALVAACAGALAASGIHAAVRFRSLAVGVLEPPAVVATQVAYAGGFIRGFVRGGR